MDQGLKERLVGAAVLVAIAVWLIPWVLDGPEEGAETPASSLQLPSAEQPMPMRTPTLKLGDASEHSAQSAPSVEPAPAPATTPPSQPALAPAEPVKDATTAPREPATGTQAAPVAEPPAETKLAAATAPAERPPPAAAATSSPKPEQSKAEGDWTVQLGSFGDEANAK